MGHNYMFVAKSRALRAFRHGHRSFGIENIMLTIEHAHHNEYQVLLPDRSEILRLIDHGYGSVSLFTV